MQTAKCGLFVRRPRSRTSALTVPEGRRSASLGHDINVLTDADLSICLSRYLNALTRVADLPLRGAGGEPVDFARTIVSHGVAELPPNRVDLERRVLETTLPVPRGARTVRITADGAKLRIETVAGTFHQRLAQTVAHMFRLDEDLSPFYATVDDELAWCANGAGRMPRAPTVFEDVVKTI
jgi:vacuolar-type H+-ATPase subunit B/Vma2